MLQRLRGGVSRETAWLLPVVLPVTLAGAVVVAAGFADFIGSRPSLSVLGGLLALYAAAAFVEAFPVPIEAVYQDQSETSLANVFIVGTAVIYGWAAATVVAFLTMALVESVRRRQDLNRVLYNSALYALAAAAAGGAAALAPGDDLRFLLFQAGLGSFAFYAVNVGLLCAVIARSGREPVPHVAARYVRWTAVPFLIMASVTVMLAVLWDRSPFLAVALAGPLIAIALYQRSVHRAVEAMRLASTDPLTGLGNHGHFHERLAEALQAAETAGEPLTLCLLDLDDFKSINDTHGHPVGDRVLAQLAQQLRESDDAFRLGGDEFALLMPGLGEREALETARALVARLTEASFDHGEKVSVSAGVAAYPEHAIDRAELVRAADQALYRAKGEGKGRAAGYRADTLDLTAIDGLARGSDRKARLRAAAALAHAVDAHAASTGGHSHTVGELAAGIARRLALPREDVELVRLTGRLHDLGKLAIPEEILRKPGPLSDGERRVLERHPEIGFRMLQSLGIDPVARWVLHHHERWDGGGYPGGLAGPEIPLGARIVFVADAYDAISNDRVYGERRSPAAAVVELERCAGTQFDPAVVAALRAEVDVPLADERRSA